MGHKRAKHKFPLSFFLLSFHLNGFRRQAAIRGEGYVYKFTQLAFKREDRVTMYIETVRRCCFFFFKNKTIESMMYTYAALLVFVHPHSCPFIYGLSGHIQLHSNLILSPTLDSTVCWDSTRSIVSESFSYMVMKQLQSLVTSVRNTGTMVLSYWTCMMNMALDLVILSNFYITEH